ncbi:hypothetical protein BJ968_004723 [Kineococcus aurantiacus]|uniref:Uncharacterized protein n=1 Tax=Kineococcus aurantiacus TaxID=37633 RepID=A0A7Y9DQU8_9ACTN|nr:hypothetical protein [Kineococcus aurantiacus]
MRKLGSVLSAQEPSLYAHFPGSRTDLVTQSLAWHAHRFAQDLLPELNSVESAEGRWDGVVRTHFRRQLALPGSDL